MMNLPTVLGNHPSLFDHILNVGVQKYRQEWFGRIIEYTRKEYILNNKFLRDVQRNGKAEGRVPWPEYKKTKEEGFRDSREGKSHPG